MKPKIYTLNSESWIGNLGKNSIRVQQPKCKACNRELKEEIKYSKVDIEIKINYNKDELRPSSFEVNYKIDGEKFNAFIKN